MNSNKLSILILDNGRQALPFIINYHKYGHKVIVVSDTILCETFFSIYPNKKIIWPHINSVSFVETLISYIKNNKIDFVLSVGDTTSRILSEFKKEILEYSNIIQPDYDIFKKATDKLLLMEYCIKNNIPCPISYALNNDTIINNCYDLHFPVIVKPRQGIGAIGVKKINSYSELKDYYNKYDNRNGDLLIQEYIPQNDGIQYQAEAFLSRTNKVVSCVILQKPRYFPVDGGTSSVNYTISNDSLKNISKKLLEGIKWEGAADIDYVFDSRDKQFKVLEINPRVTAGIKTVFKANVDLAKLHLDLALGKELKKIDSYINNICCRNLVLEILWFCFTTTTNRKVHLKSFLNFIGKNVYYQTFDVRDPFTAIGFILHITKQYLSFQKLREKFHK